MATACHRAGKRGERLHTGIFHAQGSTPVKSAPGGTGKAGPPSGTHGPGGTPGLQGGSASATGGGEGKSHSEHVQHSREDLTPSSCPRLCCLSHGLCPLSRTRFLRSIAKGTQSQGGNGSIPSFPAVSPATGWKESAFPAENRAPRRCSASSQGLAGIIPRSGMGPAGRDTRTLSSSRRQAHPSGLP